MMRMIQSQLFTATPPTIAKMISSSTSTQSNAISRAPPKSVRVLLLVVPAEVDVLARVVRAAAGPGLREPAAEHVERDGNGREDPEQPRVDARTAARGDPEPHQVEHEHEELAREEERLRLARVTGARRSGPSRPVRPHRPVVASLRSRHSVPPLSRGRRVRLQRGQ